MEQSELGATILSLIVMLLGGSTLPQFQLEIPQFLYVSDVICEEMTEENFTPHCVHAPEVQEKFVFDDHDCKDCEIEDRFADDD